MSGTRLHGRQDGCANGVDAQQALVNHRCTEGLMDEYCTLWQLRGLRERPAECGTYPDGRPTLGALFASRQNLSFSHPRQWQHNRSPMRGCGRHASAPIVSAMYAPLRPISSGGPVVLSRAV